MNAGRVRGSDLSATGLRRSLSMTQQVQCRVCQEVDRLRHGVRQAGQEAPGAREGIGIDVARGAGEVVQITDVAVEVPVEE